MKLHFSRNHILKEWGLDWSRLNLIRGAVTKRPPRTRRALARECQRSVTWPLWMQSRYLECGAQKGRLLQTWSLAHKYYLAPANAEHNRGDLCECGVQVSPPPYFGCINWILELENTPTRYPRFIWKPMHANELSTPIEFDISNTTCSLNFQQKLFQ